MMITLCGSARFEPWFHMWNEALGLAGHAAFGLSAYPSSHDGEKDWYTPEQKRTLDDVHIQKIQASDAVIFLNPFAYLGESTLRELQHAKDMKKDIFFLESWGIGCGIVRMHSTSLREAAESYGVPRGYGSPIATHEFRSLWDGDFLGHAGQQRNDIVRLIADRVVTARSIRR